jgi:anionic cell wall polymer biosynthesis LytR-Cps2A-Psr (LCP) family protein
MPENTSETAIVSAEADIAAVPAIEEKEEPPDPLRPVWIVLLGYGGGSHDGGGLADTIIAAKIAPRDQKIHLYSLPRDLWVSLPITAQPDGEEKLWNKLNTTWAIGNSKNQYSWRDEIYQGTNGGGNLAKNVVGEILGVKIDYYLGVNFAEFVKVIETITGSDGLRVNVPYHFVDEHYPIEGEENNICDWSEEDVTAMTATMSGEKLEAQFPCRYEQLEFNAGWQNIEATELLKFVRSRHSGVGGGDFGRSQRQQVVLEAVKNKVFSLSMIPKLPAMLAQIFKMIKTDVDLDLVKQAIFDYERIDNFKLTTTVIDNKELLQDGRANGAYILQPRAGLGDYTQIQAMIAGDD